MFQNGFFFSCSDHLQAKNSPTSKRPADASGRSERLPRSDLSNMDQTSGAGPIPTGPASPWRGECKGVLTVSGQNLQQNTEEHRTWVHVGAVGTQRLVLHLQRFCSHFNRKLLHLLRFLLVPISVVMDTSWLGVTLRSHRSRGKLITFLLPSIEETLFRLFPDIDSTIKN